MIEQNNSFRGRVSRRWLIVALCAGFLIALPAITGLEARGDRFRNRESIGAFAAELARDLNKAGHVVADDDVLRYSNPDDDLRISIRDRFVGDSPGRVGTGTSPLRNADFWKGRFRPIFVKAIRLPNRSSTPGTGTVRRFISMRNGGLMYSDDGKTFRRIRGLPRRFVPTDYSGPVLYRDVTDLWQNPVRPLHLLALNKHDILQSKDGGLTFRAMRSPGAGGNYTAVSGWTDSRGRLLEIWLGTSVNAIYRIRLSRGRIIRRRYTKESRGLPHYKHDSSNWLFEGITGLVTDSKRGLVLATTRFRTGLFIARRNGRARLRFREIRMHDLSSTNMGQSLAYRDGRAMIGLVHGAWVFDLNRNDLNRNDLNRKVSGKAGSGTRVKHGLITWEGGAVSGANGEWSFMGVLLPEYRGKVSISFNKVRTRKDIPRGLKAIYISPTTAKRASRRRKALRLMKKYGFNAAVIDVKDDFGRLTYGSKLPEARQMGNGRERAPIRKLVRDLKAQGVYTIARQVVFKDNRVFKYRRNKYAIRTRGGGVWVGKNADGTNNIERWTDTFATWVHDYNVRIAKEVLELGFDEIQFDYIRFPSDGGVGRCRWRYRKRGAYKSEALEAFLRRARGAIRKPISIDIYGYNGIYRVSGLVGQDLVDMGDYVDVVSPMHYSSHFGPRYLEHVRPRTNRTRELLRMGTARPTAMSRGRFAIRPWLQAFKMSVGRWGWGEPYMEAQIKGTKDGGGVGYLWWGPLSLFYLPGRVHKRLDGK